MTVLITGAAGFIGYHLSQHLLNQGKSVIGIDNLNHHYDVTLKQARLANLRKVPKFSFHLIDLTDQKAMNKLIADHSEITEVVHLAAQAGVRSSLKNPYAYVQANVMGHVTLFEACRQLPQLKRLIYASSSSVYGANEKLPFSISDPVDHPISIYAATKRSSELLSYTYSHLYEMPITGLRFFTVYGPWGRPDMSAFLFTKAILSGEEIALFNRGDMRRNFTYVGDAVQGIVGCLEQLSSQKEHQLYNIGNNQTEPLMRFINILEDLLGKKAKIRLEGMQAGDVKETIADISESTRDLGFIPKTNIEEGLRHFVDWYRSFYAL